MGNNSSRSRRMAVLLAGFTVLTAACSGTSDTLEYKHDNAALFQVPVDWHVYPPDELDSVAEMPFVTNFGGQLAVVERVGFDGAPSRGIENLGVDIANAEFPIGSFVIRTVGSSEREALSRGLLESAVLWPETYVIGQNGALEEDFGFGDSYEGIRRFLPFQDQDTENEGLVYFITVTDPGDTRIFSMAAGCSVACWEVYGDEIVEVVNSWLVNTRQ